MLFVYSFSVLVLHNFFRKTMSLLQNLPYKDYQKASKFTIEQCESLARLAKLKNTEFAEAKKPGELLLKNLDRRGFTIQEYKSLISSLSIRKHEYYKPNSKVAILIGNDKYVHLPKLATPPADCDLLSSKLTNMGFNAVTLKNMTAKCLKNVVRKIFDVVPEDSYCLIYYAGHGCEVNNTTCILGVDAPSQNILSDHCVTQEFLLDEAVRCKLDLCVVVLDMCRNNLDSQSHPNLYSQIKSKEISLKQHKNLIICYATQSEGYAYEVLELVDYSKTMFSNMTYELNTSDLANVLVSGSQYAAALCKYLSSDDDVSEVLDRVHRDLENAVKQQKPLKLRFGDAKRSLHDSAIGDVKDLLRKLEEIGKDLNIYL